MKSKLICVLLGVAALLWGCGGASEPGYVIEGAAPAETGFAVLTYDTPAGETVRDTARFADGRYVFRGTVDDVVMGSVAVYPEGGEPDRIFLYVENSPIVLADGKASGSPNNDFMRGMEKAGDSVDRNDSDSPGKIHQALLDYTLSNPDVEAAAFMFHAFSRQATYQELLDGFSRFTPRVQNCYLAERLREDLAARKVTAPGLPAPDFTLPGLDGASVALSSLRGSVVLIDFWASWCKPCRESMPGLKDLYAKYHAKGFEILGVSVDSDADAWRKAVDDVAGPWIHVLDASQGKNKSTMAAELYGVRAVPTFFLVDREGRIVGKPDHDALPAELTRLLD